MGTSNNEEDHFATLSYLFTGLGSILVDLRFGMAGAGLAGIFAMAPWIILGWLNSKE